MARGETKVLTAHVPVELSERVDAHAARLERSRGWIIKQALADWVAHEEEKERLTREAMRDVDTGRLIDHAKVRRWVDSLGSVDPLPVPDKRK